MTAAVEDQHGCNDNEEVKKMCQQNSFMSIHLLNLISVMTANKHGLSNWRDNCCPGPLGVYDGRPHNGRTQNCLQVIDLEIGKGKIHV